MSGPSIDRPYIDPYPIEFKHVSKSDVYDQPWEIKKPWGLYADLFRTEGCVVKKITVAPNQRLSLQRHENRNEVWIVLSGTGKAEIYQETILKGPFLERSYLLLPGCRVDIKQGELHRLSAGAEGIEVLELQHGKCSEEDIVRYEDDYGRIAK